MRLSVRFWFAPLVLCVPLLILIFGRIVNFELRKDEQIYASPALLLKQYSLYRDIFFNHTPGSAWLFHWIMQALGTDQVLFAARMGVFLGWVAFAIFLVFVSYGLARSQILACVAVLFILCNETLLNQTGMAATNNFLPLALAYMGMGLFLLGTAENGIKPLVIAIGGFALAMAAAFKVNSLAFIPPVALAAFFLPRSLSFSGRLKWVVAPLAAGGILGSFPVIIYLIFDYHRFLAHILDYHLGPHIAYWASQVGGDEQVAMGLGAKAKLAYSTWFSGANLLFVFCVVFLLFCLKNGKSLRYFFCRIVGARILMVSGCVFLSVVMSFVPTPAFPQYFALPLAAAPLLLAVTFAELDNAQAEMAERGLIAAGIAMFLASLPPLVEHAPQLITPKRWTVEQVHAAGIKLAGLVADAGVKGKILTFAPVYPLEGGLNIYPEFSSGPFAYRIAEFTDPQLLKFYRTTSPDQIGAFLQADPPAAILVGFDSTLEVPLVKFAEENSYRRVENVGISDRYGNGVLFIRSTTSVPNN